MIVRRVIIFIIFIPPSNIYPYRMQAGKKDYTHFLGLPFIRHTQRTLLAALQTAISAALLQKYPPQSINENKVNLAHLSLCMLTLEDRHQQRRADELMRTARRQLQQVLDRTALRFHRLNYFSRFNQDSKRREVTVIYAEMEEDGHFEKVVHATDLLVRALLEEGLVRQQDLRRLRIAFHEKEKVYKCEHYHLTLFRLRNVEENEEFKAMFAQLTHLQNPLELSCDFVDVSTRFHYDSTGFYRPLARVLLDSNQ